MSSYFNDMTIEELAADLAALARGVEHSSDDAGTQVETLARIQRVAQAAEHQAVMRMMDRGATWTEVGRRLGISRQAVRQRFGSSSSGGDSQDV